MVLFGNCMDNYTFYCFIHYRNTLFSLLYAMEEILDPQITVKRLQIMVLVL
jgi:hypothetical protein